MLVVQGGRYAFFFLDTLTEVTEIPVGLIYAGLPVGCILFLIALADSLRRYRDPVQDEEHVKEE